MDEIEWMVSLLTTYGSFLPSSSNYSCLAARNQPTTPSQRVVFQPSTVRSLWAHVVFKPISGCPIFRPSDASSLMEEASCVWFGARLSEPMGPNPPREWVRSNNPINVWWNPLKSAFFLVSLAAEMEKSSTFLLPTNPKKPFLLACCEAQKILQRTTWRWRTFDQRWSKMIKEVDKTYGWGQDWGMDRSIGGLNPSFLETRNQSLNPGWRQSQRLREICPPPAWVQRRRAVPWDRGIDMDWSTEIHQIPGLWMPCLPHHTGDMKFTIRSSVDPQSILTAQKNPRIPSSPRRSRDCSASKSWSTGSHSFKSCRNLGSQEFQAWS